MSRIKKVRINTDELEDYLESINMSRYDFSQAMYTSQSYLSQVKKNNGMLPIGKYRQMLDALDKPDGAFLHEDQSPISPEEIKVEEEKSEVVQKLDILIDKMDTMTKLMSELVSKWS